MICFQPFYAMNLYVCLMYMYLEGGERKRLCVGMELLTDPALLFLDEPTSGLDSVTSLSLMQTLKHLCDSGTCTVVSAKIYDIAYIFYTLYRPRYIVLAWY